MGSDGSADRAETAANEKNVLCVLVRSRGFYPHSCSSSTNGSPTLRDLNANGRKELVTKLTNNTLNADQLSLAIPILRPITELVGSPALTRFQKPPKSESFKQTSYPK